MYSSEIKTELHIQNLDLEADPGKYACNGTNTHGTDQAIITLRVRNRLAALWPFLGIVAEVLVLVTIIFIYEKRRKPEEVLDGELAPCPLLPICQGPGHHPRSQYSGGCFGVEGQPPFTGQGQVPGFSPQEVLHLF